MFGDYEIRRDICGETYLVVRTILHDKINPVFLTKLSESEYNKLYFSVVKDIQDHDVDLFNSMTVNKITRTYRGEIYRGIVLTFSKK